MFDFLKDVTVEEVKEKAVSSRVGKGYPAIAGDFRIKRSGKIEFTDEFRTKVNEGWIDVIFSADWAQYPKEQPAVVFFRIAEKDAKPSKADIKKEGGSVYVKEVFLAKATAMWNINWEDTAYVDFKMHGEALIVPVADITKAITRGESKGGLTYERREKNAFYPIYPLLDADIPEVVDTEEDAKEMIAPADTVSPVEEVTTDEGTASPNTAEEVPHVNGKTGPIVIEHSESFN